MRVHCHFFSSIFSIFHFLSFHSIALCSFLIRCFRQPLRLLSATPLYLIPTSNLTMVGVYSSSSILYTYIPYSSVGLPYSDPRSPPTDFNYAASCVSNGFDAYIGSLQPTPLYPIPSSNLAMVSVFSSSSFRCTYVPCFLSRSPLLQSPLTPNRPRRCCILRWI